MFFEIREQTNYGIKEFFLSFEESSFLKQIIELNLFHAKNLKSIKNIINKNIIINLI